MSSARGLARQAFILKGVNYPYGSIEENIAISALYRENNVQFQTTLAIISAIMHVGHQIGSALTGGQSPGTDAMQKIVDDLKNFLVPHADEARDARAAEIKKTLEREAGRGPIKVQAMTRQKRKRGRAIRQRRQ